MIHKNPWQHCLTKLSAFVRKKNHLYKAHLVKFMLLIVLVTNLFYVFVTFIQFHIWFLQYKNSIFCTRTFYI